MFRIFIQHPAWTATSEQFPKRRVVSENERRSYWTGTRWGARRYAAQLDLDAARQAVREILDGFAIVRFQPSLPEIEEIKIEQ